jgi:hypothetical protein
VDNPYEAPKASLLQTVARANRCRVVWSKELGLVTVIGFPADLDAIELLFTSLLVQANTAMLRAGAKRDAHGRSRTRAFRQSFLVSYAIRIGERLSEATGQAEQQAAAEHAAARGGGGKDLVPFLAARHQAVDDAVDAIFGHTLTTSRAVRATDAEGWHSGRVAADMASLHNHAQVVGATTLRRVRRFLRREIDPHRLNVATSRAKALAIVVASPRLIQASCQTPGQMALVNALRRAWEFAF